ncbi:DAK2 domain-containing protein [Streptomyces nogalater]|uniref:DAK2 domain-containing protein n=1 Tax=Streptomyces nogalater TaxID=38314 RepID=A0ABW0WQS4_STRNO
MPQTFFDALAVRTWCSLALRALGGAREEIDAINVYPVADGDTGTNLYLTLESAATAVEAVFAGYETGRAEPSLGDAARAMAHGALIGARGNSGTILAQLLRGMAQVLAEAGETSPASRADGPGLGLALRRAPDSARQAVARPVEGTVLAAAGWLPVVLCGRNERLYARMSREPAALALSWVDDMPGLLAAGYALVDNAAGQTAVQALAAGLPVVAHRPLPGHGAEGVHRMADLGLCALAPDGPALLTALDALGEGTPERAARVARGHALFRGDALEGLSDL